MSQPGNGENPPPYTGPPSYGYPTYPTPQGGQPGYPPYGQPPGYPPQYGPAQPYPGMPPYPQHPYGAPGYGYGMAPAPVPGGRLAGMGARLGGLLLDALIIAAPVLVIAAAAGAFHSTRTCTFDGCTRKYDFNAGWAVNVVGIALSVLYTALLVGLQGQTVGHRVAGIRVVDLNTGALIGPGRAALRWLVLGLTGALCTLGYWSPYFDSLRRQGWHDKASNAVVIPSR